MDRLGATLGDRYRLLREVGRGGMATVFLADELKHGRQVAVKVLRPEVAASVGAERFLLEIGIVARLSHPHILPLIDSGESGGFLYYVSPYVSGGSLRDLLKKEWTLECDHALRIVEQVADGLDYAHRMGFVHRDVKPENILFAEGHAMLADFGIARAFTVSDADQITEGGMALGTPQYMSPEQASGDRDIGAQSDIYALGCVLYEMLGGESPFGGGNGRTTIARQVTEIPRPIRILRPDASLTVERALAKALAKDPADRFGSASEFVAAARAVDVAANSPARKATRNIAVIPFVNASADSDNEYLSDGITDELINALTKVQGLRVASRTSVFALKGKAQDVRSIGAALGSSVILEGTVRKAGDQLRITAQLSSAGDGQVLWSQRYDRQLVDVFAIQDEIAQTIVNTLRATLLADISDPQPKRYTENIEAYGLYLRGRYAWNKRTNEGIVEAIELFRQAIAVDPNYALAYTGLSDSFALHVDYRSVPVVEGFEKATEYALRAIELDETLAEAHTSLAWATFIYGWNWEAAGREFRRAIELQPQYATAHQWYAFLLASQGRLDEALEEGHTAVDLDQTSVSVRRSIGWLYYYARKYEQAAYHLRLATAMNPEAEETYRVLGLTLAVGGDNSEGERVLRQAVRMPASSTHTLATLGFVLARSGKRDEAIAIRDKLRATAEKGYVSPVAFATIELGLGNFDATLDWMEEALADRRGWLAYIGVHPILDPLRELPRFRSLLGRMGLSGDQRTALRTVFTQNTERALQ